MYSCPARQMSLYDIVLVERFVLALLKVNIIIIITDTENSVDKKM